MTEEKKLTDNDLKKVEAALRRAALRAREVARQTGTPLVVYKNGRIVKELVEQKSK
ncbi:MAG: hypothetical protein LWX02_05995 [Deltaproteobacteria bacterium]|jgi:hypothetical protein|nr:hypothetical protein [Deltaproteobacteria bacterium]MDL1987887.1 hypothetical protein [Deltaproteobacteria bacterium]